jgi:hypothetical protein
LSVVRVLLVPAPSTPTPLSPAVPLVLVPPAPGDVVPDAAAGGLLSPVMLPLAVVPDDELPVLLVLLVPFMPVELHAARLRAIKPPITTV